MISLNFNQSLGVALVPTEESNRAILELTNLVFSDFPVVEDLHLSETHLPHVSLFQNLFADPNDLTKIVAEAFALVKLPKIYKLQAPPSDLCVWSGDRPFVNIDVPAELALFHDWLLVKCLGLDPKSDSLKICAAKPADSRPLSNLSSEQEAAHLETGYVFSGASSAVSAQYNISWKAFNMPHFTLGVVDWTTYGSKPASPPEIEEGSKKIVSRMRAAVKNMGVEKVNFSKLVVFKVQPGGIYNSGKESTVQEWEI